MYIYIYIYIYQMQSQFSFSHTSITIFNITKNFFNLNPISGVLYKVIIKRIQKKKNIGSMDDFLYDFLDPK